MKGKKERSFFLAVLALGFGTYHLLRQFAPELDFPIHGSFALWLLFGLAFLAEGIFGKDKTNLFPGIVLCGIGIIFTFVDARLSILQTVASFLAVLGIAFFFRQPAAKQNKWQIPFLLLGAACAVLLYDRAAERLFAPVVQNAFAAYWPFLLIALGFLFLRKS